VSYFSIGMHLCVFCAGYTGVGHSPLFLCYILVPDDPYGKDQSLIGAV